MTRRCPGVETEKRIMVSNAFCFILGAVMPLSVTAWLAFFY